MTLTCITAVNVLYDTSNQNFMKKPLSDLLVQSWITSCTSFTTSLYKVGTGGNCPVPLQAVIRSLMSDFNKNILLIVFILFVHRFLQLTKYERLIAASIKTTVICDLMPFSFELN
jgi:hypothetical protein